MGKVLASQHKTWRDWQAAKRQFQAQPPRPPGRRRGIMASPLPLLAALLLLCGLFWLVVSDGLEPRYAEPEASVPAVLVNYDLCGSSGAASCVIDGDTLRVDGVTIRIADIHAPEVFSPDCPLEEMIGRRAARRLADLASGRPFSLVARPRDGDEDVYGRKLRVLVRDGRSLGATLVFEGLASRTDRSWCPA